MSTLTPNPIRVLIADDHPVAREGLRHTLDSASDITVIAEAHNGIDALRFTRHYKPDILLLDVEMPGKTGVEVARELSASHPEIKILAFSSYDDEAYVYGLLKNGAKGYLMKEEATTSQVADAIRGIVLKEEDNWISPRLAAKLVKRRIKDAPYTNYQLTQRELDVLQAAADGSDNESLGQKLNISYHTVKNHVNNIKDKIGVRSRAELVAWAWQNGLVESS